MEDKEKRGRQGNERKIRKTRGKQRGEDKRKMGNTRRTR